MNYFRCGGGSEKVTIDGVKVRDKMDLGMIFSTLFGSTLPYKFHQGSAVVLDGEIHILGGSKHYKWDGSTWTSVSTLLYNLYYGSAVVLNREIHILGGLDSVANTKHYKILKSYYALY